MSQFKAVLGPSHFKTETQAIQNGGKTRERKISLDPERILKHVMTFTNGLVTFASFFWV